MNILITILLLSISVEAITEILIDSRFSEIIRNTKFFEKAYSYIDCMFFRELFSCGYCLSVWVAAFLSLLLAESISSWIIYTFVSHRLANLFHVIYELVRRGRVRYLDISMNRSDEDGDAG